MKRSQFKQFTIKSNKNTNQHIENVHQVSKLLIENLSNLITARTFSNIVHQDAMCHNVSYWTSLEQHVEMSKYHKYYFWVNYSWVKVLLFPHFPDVISVYLKSLACQQLENISAH